MKRKLLRVIALCAAALLLLSACSAKSTPNAKHSADQAAYSASAPAAAAPMEMYSSTESAAPQFADNSGTSSSTSDPADVDVRKIIYNANMDVTADDPAIALQAVIDKAKALGGYVSNSNTSNDEEGASYCSVTLKVPAERLEELVSAARGVGKVNDYRLYSDDITMWYYDTQARLDNAKAEEAQLLIILEKCTTVEEILQVRESLTKVRGDIESYQGQINLWDNLVGYATLDMSIRRTPKTMDSAEGDLLAFWKTSDVWKSMSRGFQNSIRWIVNAVYAIGIFLAIAIIPAAILFLCIGLPIILRRRKKKKLAAEKAAQAQEIDPSADQLAKAEPAQDAAASTDQPAAEERPAE